MLVDSKSQLHIAAVEHQLCDLRTKHRWWPQRDRHGVGLSVRPSCLRGRRGGRDGRRRDPGAAGGSGCGDGAGAHRPRSWAPPPGGLPLPAPLLRLRVRRGAAGAPLQLVPVLPRPGAVARCPPGYTQFLEFLFEQAHSDEPSACTPPSGACAFTYSTGMAQCRRVCAIATDRAAAALWSRRRR